jgi:hypothetical protein
MMAEKEESVIIEQGDIFFFYRPKVGKEEVQDIEDIQRFYMVTATDSGKYRLFILGSKKLPTIVEGRSDSEERNWAINILTTDDPEDLRKELLAYEYETEKGQKRRVEAAVPVGEGKYAIAKHRNHTELVYVLELPKQPGPAQEEFEIKKEASYIISVKNPDISVQGFAASNKRKPQYPSHIKKKFGNRRWINVDDPEILNYQYTQLLLIGARKKDVEEELGVDIDEEKETQTTSELFKVLKLRRDEVPLRPLLKAKFPDKQEIRQKVAKQEVIELPQEEAPGRGGKVGGKIALEKAASAASVARILSGARFPMNKEELVSLAQKNKQNIHVSDETIQVIRNLPKRRYNSMADVEKALGEIR